MVWESLIHTINLHDQLAIHLFILHLNVLFSTGSSTSTTMFADVELLFEGPVSLL